MRLRRDRLDIRLLGPVRAYAGHRQLDLGPRKQRLVLAVLALAVNHAVPVDHLVELAWPIDPPRTAAHAVRVCVSGLRSVLAGQADAEIDTRGAGYALRADPELIDASRFLELLKRAAVAPDDPSKVELLDEALALWSGPTGYGTALSGTAPAETQEVLCRGLEESRLNAIEDRLDAELRLGHHRAVLAEVSGLARTHPTRERLAGQLMISLYRDGRQTEALATYQRLHTRLGEVFGVDPGPAVRELQLAILRDDPALRPASGLGPTPPAQGPVHLPPVSGDIIGRAAELEHLRLAGAIFLRAEYTEAWALAGQGGPAFATMMHPGAQRLVLFHVVADGRCSVSLADGRSVWAGRGDVIVLPYGDTHTMGGVADVEPVHITTLLAPPPWDQLPVLRLGGGGSRTDVVCGFLFSQDPLFNPALRALPAAFVVSPPPGPARNWVDASIAYALAAPTAARGVQPTKLAELLLIEMLRVHLLTAPAAEHGWLAALRDPVLAPAVQAIHAAPERRWTVANLAAQAGVSHSLLDRRFQDVLGMPPIRYLHEWRMHVANDLLTTTEATVAAIARRVGYESEEVFSRAFKRARGLHPSQWLRRT